MKQVIIVNASLKMPPGKMAAQVAHAAVEAAVQVGPHVRNYWFGQGMTKIVLKGDSKEQLEMLQKQAKMAFLPTALIVDEGRTCIPPDSTTCLAIGPAEDAKIDLITSHLKLIR